MATDNGQREVSRGGLSSRICPKAFADPKDFKQLAAAVSEKIKKECPGVVWKDSLATLGRCISDNIGVEWQRLPRVIEKRCFLPLVRLP